MYEDKGYMNVRRHGGEFDMDEFRRDVCEAVAFVPYGKVATYGQIAWLVRRPRNFRLVGRVLRGVPASSGIPCHRVVNGSGRTAPHWAEQRPMLESEGVLFRKNGCVDMRRCRWNCGAEE